MCPFFASGKTTFALGSTSLTTSRAVAPAFVSTARSVPSSHTTA